MTNGVRIVGDMGRLERKLRALQKPALARVGRTVGEALVSSTIERFNAQRDPTGKPWAALSVASTFGSLRRKDFTKRGQIRKASERKLKMRKILIDTARLRNSISSKAVGNVVAVGTNVAYARVHQMGGEAGRKKARVTIPARPFLGVSDADKREIKRIVDDEIAGGGL
jgi:phage virion morphogenesis protein